MKKTFLFFSLNLLIATSFAQTMAVTSNGDEVLLNADGTWKYVNDSLANNNSINTNKISFLKSVNSGFVVKSNKVKYGFYIDPKKWSFEKGGSNDAAEFTFHLKEKDAYGMVIAEKTEIPLESLRSIVLKNAKDAGPDITIARQEYRKVNGNTVLLIQMSGTVEGIKVTYMGYYFSSPEGSLQLLTYSATNLFDEYKNDLEEFLNGFVTLK